VPRRLIERLRIPALESFRDPVEGLMVLNRWFVRLRWLAVVVLFLILAITRWAVGIHLPMGPLTALGAVLAVYNLLFYWYLEDLAGRAEKEITYRVGEKFANLQIAADLVCITALLHFSGGVENPFSTFYVFHVIIASIMLPRGQSYFQALLAVTLFAGLALFEYEGILPHYHLPEYMLTEQYRNWKWILGHLAVLAVTLVTSAFFTASLANRLRERHAELVKTSAQLAELEARKSRFMRLAAHQLRAPLSAVRSLLSVSLGEYELSAEKRQELIHRASARTEQLLKLLGDLLALSRLRSTRVEAAEQELVAPDDMLDRVVALFRPQAGENGVAIHTDLHAGGATVLAAPDRLRDVFTNLVSNAVKYTPTGGRVTVTTRVDGSTMVCEVADTGIGIPPEDQAHLFEEFFRASNAREFEQEGTGLGLSIIKEIAEAMGGSVGCESEVGKGTCFTLTLPRAATPRKPRQDGTT